MGTRRHDYNDDDDRPRRRRRYDDDDDDYDDRPRRRVRRRRRSPGPGVGKVIGIIVGCLAAVGVVIAIALGFNGAKSFGTGSINYQQYEAINEQDTIAGIEKRHGRGRKIDPSEWAKTGPGYDQQPRGANGFDVRLNTTLAAYRNEAREVTAWYRWKKGKEEVYVAEGTDLNGRQGLVIKLYYNPQVLEDFVRNPTGPKPAHPWCGREQIGVGGRVQLGGP